MIVVKLLLLQIMAIIGLFAGKLIAPEVHLSTFMPSSNESELIHYTDMHINFILGFVVMFASISGRKVLRLPLACAFFVTIFAGILFGFTDSLRAGVNPSIDYPLMFSYFLGMSSMLGLIKITDELWTQCKNL